jgi:hypothetical protein
MYLLGEIKHDIKLCATELFLPKGELVSLVSATNVPEDCLFYARPFYKIWKNEDGTFNIRSHEDSILITDKDFNFIKNIQIKTAVIFNTYEELVFFVVDGDWTRFQDVYINSINDCNIENYEGLQAELQQLVYDHEGTYKIQPVENIVFAQELRDGALIVECGLMP